MEKKARTLNAKRKNAINASTASANSARFERMNDFFHHYFTEPITRFSGYNTFNTLIYFAILAIAAFLIFKLLDKKGIKFNAKFAIAVIPFILLGSALRVIEDLRILPRSANPLELGFYTISPGIYIAVGIYAIAMLFLARWTASKTGKNFEKVFGTIGLLTALPFLAFDALQFKEIAGFFTVLAVSAAASAIVWFGMKKALPEFAKDKTNVLLIGAQALEGISIFVSTQFYKCGQAHEFSNIILSAFPLAFPLLKIVVIIALLWLLDAEVKNENARGFIKLVLLILSLAMGARNTITLAVGTCS